MKIGVVGGGLIGRSWAVAFARAGCQVAVHCRSSSQAQELRAWVTNTCNDLRKYGLQEEGAEALLGRVECVTDLERAVAGADFVQENLPEDTALKREIFGLLERHAPADATLASSTSALPASAFASELASRHRCLVAHPVNPPHLVPLVEIVPAPWTDPVHMQRTQALMQGIGQVPIIVTQEIPGFVLNRLQAALLAEAWRLVEDGVASADDVDKAVRDGLGLRWAFIGPFENGDLNAPDGIGDYARRYGGMLRGLCESMGAPRVWGEALIARVERERRALLPLVRQPERMRWRDTRLMALRALKGDYRGESATAAASQDPTHAGAMPWK
ncbi:3-hydroxyacyl-CoA dehydrogenase [Variovorax ureilyticus]|uniref:3-hydroxyacyl-CoA dehydrogenase n=1 Tax=Variovorax ureilyticus TaxID=1836198 RepID=A0ABU8VNP6_9BURK